MAEEATLPQDPGSSAGSPVVIQLPKVMNREYILNSDFTYTGPINFQSQFSVDYSTVPSSLIFRGLSGEENFSFSGMTYGMDTIERDSAFSLYFTHDWEMNFENLNSFSITNNRSLYFISAQTHGDSRYSIRNIRNDVIVSGNVTRSSIFGINASNIKDSSNNGTYTPEQLQGTLSFNISDIGGNVRFTDNSGGEVFNFISRSPGLGSDPIVAGASMVSRVEFKNIQGTLEFSRNSGVIYLDAADCPSETNDLFVDFDSIGQGVRFEGNSYGRSMMYASGIYMDLENIAGGARERQGRAFLSFSNIGGKGVEFLNGAGGAIYINGPVDAGFSITNASGVNFTGNDYGAIMHLKRGGGAVGSEFGKSMNFIISRIGGDVIFDSNKATHNGGGIYLYASDSVEGKIDMSLNNIQGNVLFLNNVAGTPFIGGTTATSQGGAVFLWAPKMNLAMENIGGSVEFSGNTATSNGGALAFSGKKALARFSQIGGDLLFSGNSAKGWGGALYFGGSNDSDLFIGNVQGNIEFRNNDAAGGGGAIGFFGARATAVFSADGGNIIFSDNMDSAGTRANSLSIRADEAHVDFRAQAGKSVIINDPLYYSVKTAGAEGTFETHLNRTSEQGQEYVGNIVFSGELYDPADGANNFISVIVGDTTLHAGTLVLEKGAGYGTFGTTAEGTVDYDTIRANSFIMRNSRLDINGYDHADTLVAARRIIFDSGSTLKPGEQAWLVSRDTDISKGLAFDLGYYLTPESVLPLAGVQILSSTLTLGNGLSIADKAAKLEYYENARWKQKQTFTLVDVTGVDTITGDFSGIISQLAGSNIVKGFGYNGTWSYENKDGQLLAIWTPTFAPDPVPEPDPEPEPEKSVLPELAGSLTLNSLWSTTSNMRAFSRAALGQVGITRFLLPKNTNYWALGLGDVSFHKNRGGIDGYDYNGYGYAVGADTHLSDSLIGGLAFGNLYGKNKSRSFNAHIDQASYMGLAYASWSGELDKTNSLVLDGTSSYGLTSNKLDTRYSDGDSSKGKWDNGSLRLTLRGEWNHSLDKNWTLTPFVGAEYDQAWQKAFTETGDKTRSFSKDSLRNLSIPIGLGLSHRMELNNGKQWINSLAVSYVPDIYRKNPESATLRTTNGFTWTAEGLRPVRNAGRVEYNTRYQFNETWALFGGYSLEGRKDSIYHNANIGISAGF